VAASAVVAAARQRDVGGGGSATSTEAWQWHSGGGSISCGGGSAKHCGGAHRDGDSAIAAVRMLWRWRQQGATRCQYCYYIWKHTYNSLEQETFNFREKNKTQTVRCLICNVNLCPICINEWHGVEMSDINGLLNL
jgi:hypothetical protein